MMARYDLVVGVDLGMTSTGRQEWRDRSFDEDNE